jgi:inosine/xanthosine triphosphate pyrophosphatase family protein/dephospho-CoA kinase
MLRPTPRHLFLAKERQPLVYFYTSNIPKFLQARIVFERAGLVLHHFKSRQEPYSEDYSLGKEELLARAIAEIVGSVGAGSLLFVEDTSLRIEALSETTDYPGLAVKEWFPQTPFDELDHKLRERHNDRRATVKSDIALHIPGLTRPVYFHGETTGEISGDPPSFSENSQYPWLTPHTFNGLFIPKGAGKRLGEMTLEESWSYDFRTQALEKLLDRLEEYTGVLNLGSQAYRVRPTEATLDQYPLLTPQANGVVLIVVGRTCAGKTTFAEYAQNNHELAFIEASSVVRMLARDQRLEGRSPFDLAKLLLETQGADIVARKIIDLYPQALLKGAVISGFRTIEELETLKHRVPEAKVVVVEASERVRFQRYLNRERASGPRDITDFRRADSEQWSFGLVRVAEDFADIRIGNEGTLEDYHRAIEALLTKPDLSNTVGVSTKVHPRVESDANQLFRCLAALRSAGRPLSCDEIQVLTAQTGHVVRHNNANKVLKRAPELARRLDSNTSRVRYEVLSAGHAYVRYMESYIRLKEKNGSTVSDGINTLSKPGAE